MLLHASLSSSAWCFDGQFADRRLSSTFNLIAVDLRYCGRTTTRLRESFSLEDNVPDVLAVLAHLGLSTFSLVGHGMLGCTIATYVTIALPSQVQALMLCSPSHLSCPPEIRDPMCNDWLPSVLVNKPGRGGDDTGSFPVESLPTLVGYFFGEKAGARDSIKKEKFLEHCQARCRSLPRGSSQVAWTLTRRSRTDGTNQPPDDMTVMLYYFHHPVVPAKERAKITCPVLILQSEADTMTSPLAEARKWQDGFTCARGGAELHVVTGAPHLVCYFDPGVSSRFMWCFITRGE